MKLRLNAIRLGTPLLAALLVCLILTPSFAGGDAEPVIKSIRMVTRGLDPRGEQEGLCMESVSFLEYDREGRLLKESKGNPVEEVVRYEYDAAGRLVKEAREFPDADEDDMILGPDKYITYEYEPRLEEPVREVYEDFTGGKTVIEKNFNKQGRLVRTTTSFSGADGTAVEESEEYTWRTDGQGNVTRRQETKSNWDWAFEMTWNADGVLILEKTIEDGGSGLNTRDTLYTYSDAGYLMRQEVVYPGNPGFNMALQFEYEFDSHGNWTKQTVNQTVGGGETLIIQVREREITYW